jgi:hypothetical protein
MALLLLISYIAMRPSKTNRGSAIGVLSNSESTSM